MNPLSKRFKRIFAFIKAPNWEKAKQVVETHSDELLDDTADMAFSFLLKTCEDDENVAQVIRQHWQVIQLCRSNDIQAVFSDDLLAQQKLAFPVDFDFSAKMDAQMAGLKPSLGPHSEVLLPPLQEVLMKTLEQNPDFFLPILQRLGERGFKELIESPTAFNEMVQELIKGNPELMDSVKDMIEQVTEQHPNILPALEEVQETLLESLNCFITADNWSESQLYLEKHPELLTIAADEEIEQEILRSQNLKHVSLLKQHQDLLRRCREIGIKQAFAELRGGSDALFAEILDNFERAQAAERNYLSMEDPSELDDAVNLWEQILNNPALPSLPEELRVTIWIDAGETYAYRYYRTERSLDDLNRMIELFQEAVTRIQPTSPKLPALFINLGNGLQDRATLTARLEDLDAAINGYRYALDFFSSASLNIPTELSELQQYQLGRCLHKRYTQTERFNDLNEAIECYRWLLQHISSQSSNKVIILRALEESLSDRYVRTMQPEDLEEASECYRKANS